MTDTRMICCLTAYLVIVWLKPTNQRDEMVLVICYSTSCNRFRLMRDCRLENFANGKEISPFRSDADFPGPPRSRSQYGERLGLNTWLPGQHVSFVVSHCGRHCDQTKCGRILGFGVFSSYLPWRFCLFNFSTCLWQRITDTKSSDLGRKIYEKL